MNIGPIAACKKFVACKSINGFIQWDVWERKLRFKVPIPRLMFWVKISSTKVRQSLIINWLCVTSDKMKIKNFVSW